MPIYEYHCDDCGQEFEVMQKITEEPLGTCKVCGGRVHRLISRNGFVLKGKGWYATDYGKGRSNGSSSTDIGAKSESSKTQSSSSESAKPDSSGSDEKKDTSSSPGSSSTT